MKHRGVGVMRSIGVWVGDAGRKKSALNERSFNNTYKSSRFDSNSANLACIVGLFFVNCFIVKSSAFSLAKRKFLILTHISYFYNTFLDFRIKTKKHLKSGACLFARLSIENRIKDNGNEGKETQVIVLCNA